MAHRSTHDLLWFLRRGLTVCVILSSLTLVASCERPHQRGTPPNIVLIIADDLNWNDLGTYGHPSLETPNLDSLADDGMLFENAYLTASSCSPSRASIITGLYPHSTGAEQLHWPLPEQPTFVQALRDAGYWTAASGKWHLGAEIPHHFHRIHDNTGLFQGTADEKKTSRSKTDILIDGSGAEHWVQTLLECDPNKPFFLWLAALDPHRGYSIDTISEPTDPSSVRIPPYLADTSATREDFANYYDEIRRLDQYVGEFLSVLNSEGLSDNTVVIFISDNGRPFPGAKTTLYDDGVKTPLLIRWPNEIQPKTRSSAIVSVVDLAPTILNLAALKPMASFEGQSFHGMLHDPSVRRRQFAFSERAWHDYDDHMRSVRSDCCRLIRNYYPDLTLLPSADALRSATYSELLRLESEGGLLPHQRRPFEAPRATGEFYDLSRDPFELDNLIDDPSYATVIEAHRMALDNWTIDTNDWVPSTRTPDGFTRDTGEILPTNTRPRASKHEMYQTNGCY